MGPHLRQAFIRGFVPVKYYLHQGIFEGLIMKHYLCEVDVIFELFVRFDDFEILSI